MATILAIARRKADAAERLASAAAGLDIAPPELSRKASPDQQTAELMEWAATTLEEIATRAPVEAPTMVSTPAAPKRKAAKSAGKTRGYSVLDDLALRDDEAPE